MSLRRFRVLAFATIVVIVAAMSNWFMRPSRAATAEKKAGRSAGPVQVGNLEVRPFLAPLPDGTFIACYTRNVSGVSEAAAIYSSDDGRSWSEP